MRSRLAARVWGSTAVGAALLGVVACDSIIGTKDYLYDAGLEELDGNVNPASDAGATVDDATTMASRDGAAPIDSGDTDDAAGDAGDGSTSCTVDCMGGACVDGVCQPVQISNVYTSIYDIELGPENLYISEANEIISVPKDGNTPAVFQSFAPSTATVNALSVVGGTLYAAVNFPGNSTSSVFAGPSGDAGSLQAIFTVAGLGMVDVDATSDNARFLFLNAQGLYASNVGDAGIATDILPITNGRRIYVAPGNAQAFVSASDALDAKSLSGAAPSSTNHPCTYIGTDGASVYFGATSSLYSAPVTFSGNDVVALPTPGLMNLQGIAADSTSVFYIDAGFGNSDGILYIYDKAMMTTRPLVKGLGSPSLLVDNLTSLFFVAKVSSGMAAYRVAKPAR